MELQKTKPNQNKVRVGQTTKLTLSWVRSPRPGDTMSPLPEVVAGTSVWTGLPLSSGVQASRKGNVEGSGARVSLISWASFPSP